jgi:hypothetical protein
MNRRDFIRAAGLSAASLAVPASLSVAADDSEGHILSGVDARIEKHRKGETMLKLVGPDGKPLASNVTLRIEQKRHKFLFGCNIFKLHKCRTLDDNAAYEKHFDELLNFATLPFYWWNYERQKGKPDDERTDEIVRWAQTHRKVCPAVQK